MAIDDLYERDYYAWTAAQAKALRARGSGGNALDYDRLAEELDDLGSERLHACESLAIQILAHFLKLQHSAVEAPRAGWKREILGFRIALKRRLSPSLRVKLGAEMAGLYTDATALTLAAFEEYEPANAASIPAECPFTLADVLGRDDGSWLPAEIGANVPDTTAFALQKEDGELGQSPAVDSE